MSAAATCSAVQQLHRPAGRQIRQQCSQERQRAGSQAAGAAPLRRGPWAPAAAAAAAAAPVAAPLSPPPQLLALDVLDHSCAASTISQDQLTEQQQEYFVNCGAAVRALQKDLPALLERQPNLEVFCEGVLFEDRLSPRLGLPAASCSGREAYSRLMWSLRFHKTLFFAATRVELLRMWEREPCVVCVRWAARASPRLLGGLVTAGSAAMSLDAVSEFHFNKRGLIMKHCVDCVSYSGPQVQVPLLARYQAAATARRQGPLVPGIAGGSCDECSSSGGSCCDGSC